MADYLLADLLDGVPKPPPSYQVSDLVGFDAEVIIETQLGPAGPPGPPSFVVLAIGAPVPPGTLPGTIIFRS